MLCKLIKKTQLTESVYDYTVFCPEMAEKTKPGQFLHILCGGDAYLRRPISVCEVIDKESIRFIFQVKGVGTEALLSKNEGDMIDILGPLGNGFNKINGKCVLVGGGIGVFPLLQLAKEIDGDVTVLLGFRSKADVLMIDEFSKYANVLVATDDGSFGHHGYVTELLKNTLQNGGVDKVYSCGPTPMMRLVSGIAEEFSVDAEVSLEERMGCGIGACVTCACTVAGKRKRVCKDGPVFNASEVEWDG